MRRFERFLVAVCTDHEPSEPLRVHALPGPTPVSAKAHEAIILFSFHCDDHREVLTGNRSTCDPDSSQHKVFAAPSTASPTSTSSSTCKLAASQKASPVAAGTVRIAGFAYHLILEARDGNPAST